MVTCRKVLIADDDASLRLVLSHAFVNAGYQVRATSSAGALLKWVREGEGDLIISDVLMPDDNIFNVIRQIQKLRPTLPVILMSGESTLLTAASAAETGVFEYLAKPFDLSAVLSAAERALLKPGQVERLLPSAARSERLPLIGRSAAMQDVYRTLARLIHCDLPVVLQGESGTGKNLAARALHQLGPRRGGNFVVVSLGGAGRERLEADLNGVNGQPGALSLAEGGTVMLDEIDDLPLESQSRLLRLLDGLDRPAAASGRRDSMPRLIVSTKREFSTLLSAGLLREDLFFRLKVAVVKMPPLRDRLEDVAELAQVFLLRAARDSSQVKTIETAAIERLRRHSWPGNVRELENMMRRLATLYPERTVSSRSIHFELSDQTSIVKAAEDCSFESLIQKRLSQEFIGGPENPPEPGLYDRVINDVGRPLLRATLTATRGNQVRAAEILGLNRNTLKKKLRALGMPTSRRELVGVEPNVALDAGGQADGSLRQSAGSPRPALAVGGRRRPTSRGVNERLQSQ